MPGRKMLLSPLRKLRSLGNLRAARWHFRTGAQSLERNTAALVQLMSPWCGGGSSQFHVMSGESTLQPVIVVGGGLAGLSAAAELAKHGTPVVVVEKMDKLGGNSAKASSGMNAAGSGPQRAQGIEDTPHHLLRDFIRSGKGRTVEVLAGEVASGSAEAVAFLEGFGVNLSSIQQLGGHSRPRTHRAAADGKPMNLGYRIMSTLIRHVQELQAKDPTRVRIVTDARATEILSTGNPPRVVGVRVAKPAEGEEEIVGSAVILTTGGYSADGQGYVAKYAPRLRNLPTTNGAFAVGDGIRLAESVGAALVDMDQVQLHPTGLVDPKDPLSQVKILGPEILRGSGGVLLNNQGTRFVNELDTRDKVVWAMWEHCAPLDKDAEACAAEDDSEECPVASVAAHLVLTQEALDKFGAEVAKFYLFKGLMRKHSSLREMCAALALPVDRVRATLEAYNAAAQGAERDLFNKSVFPCAFPLPSDSGEDTVLYSALVTPSLHYTMGGLRFDALGHVLNAQGKPIPGLLAAGEVTGGVHGGNRLAGNSLLECVVYGRKAATSALVEALTRREKLTPAEGEEFRREMQARIAMRLVEEEKSRQEVEV